MSTMQIRNVPPETVRVMKTRAAAAGQSLSEYLLTQIQQLASRPTMDEMLDRIARQPRLDGLPSSADVLRRERERA